MKIKTRTVAKVTQTPLPLVKEADPLGRIWRMETHGISQSMIALFALCPQKAHYSLIEGYKKDGTYDKALDFGSFFHDCLDAVYTCQKDKTPKVNVKAIVNKKYVEAKKRMQSAGVDIKQLQEFEISYGMCVSLLDRYFDKWKLQDKQLQWLDLEKVFSFPYKLRDGTVIQIRGKFDGVFRNDKGKLWLFETKTKSTIYNNTVMETIGYNLQVMVYMMAMKYLYGETPAGVLYNLVKRPGQQYKGTYNRKPESIPEYVERVDKDIIEKPDEYFQRYMVYIRWEEIEEYKNMDLDYMLQRFYEWQQGGYSNFRNSAACSMWNRPCEYLPICSTGNKTLYSRKLTMFPELEPNQ